MADTGPVVAGLTGDLAQLLKAAGVPAEIRQAMMRLSGTAAGLLLAIETHRQLCREEARAALNHAAAVAELAETVLAHRWAGGGPAGPPDPAYQPGYSCPACLEGGPCLVHGTVP